MIIMKTRESAENYLEAILVLSKNGKNVRSIDIATQLDFTKPSVSVAMKKLRNDGYVETNEDGYIKLTQKGLELAESIYEKHNTISHFLVLLGVDEKTALDDACKMEHILSEQSFMAIKKHMVKLGGLQ